MPVDEGSEPQTHRHRPLYQDHPDKDLLSLRDREPQPGVAHHIIYEDDQAIAHLNKYPILEGYALVAPREHREQVTGDFTPDEYLDLQHLIYQVTEAIRQEVSAEWVYIFSFGSQQGNSHVH